MGWVLLMEWEHSKARSILIVGAGPVGLTAALEFKRRGFCPRIIDKAAGPAAESRALGVNPRTLDILQPSEVTEELLKIGNRVSRVDVRGWGEHIFSVRLEKLKHCYPFMLIVPQSETERVLIAELERREVAVEWGTELMDLAWCGETSEVILATALGTETMVPDILIGADGAHSSVRRMSQIEFVGENYPVVFALADIRYETPREASTATIEVLPGGAVAIFPIDPVTFRYVGTSGDVLELAKSRHGASKILWHSEFHVSFREVETFVREPVFLAGDAAHVHSPVGARGMNLGIEDAAWLAYLVASEQGQDYSKLRRPVARAIIRRTRQQTNAMFRRGMFSDLALRYLGGVVLKAPFIEQFALRRLTGLDTPSPPWLASNDGEM